MNSTQKEEWVTTVKEEMDALVENDTWELTDCPKNVKVIDNRWVLRTKLCCWFYKTASPSSRERTCAKGRH